MEKGSSREVKLGFRRDRRSNQSPSSSASTNWRPRRSLDPTDKPATSKVENFQGGSSSMVSERDRSTDGTVVDDDDDGQQSLDSPSLIGACPDMCPEKERAQREQLRDLSVFERLNGNPGRTTPNLAVKKFCRSISTTHVKVSDIRSPPVLRRTLRYLLSLVDSSEFPFEVVHDFVFDRMRSIRQDLSMQRAINHQAIDMYEEMVKFHIVSHQKLARCCDKSDMSSLCYLNMEQLMKCLLTLFSLYGINRRSESTINKNEAEFYSFYVLLHLGCKTPTMGDSLSLWFLRLPYPIMQSKEMCFARTILRYSKMGNYRRFFTTIAAEASSLQLSLMEPFLNEVRSQAIRCINSSGYKLQPYPLLHLSDVLMIKEQELESLCSICGLQTTTDDSGNKLLPAKQMNFCRPKAWLQSYSLSCSRRL